MSQTELLIKEIEGLPAAYMEEVIDFVGYLKRKTAPPPERINPPAGRAENAYRAIEELEGFGLACGSTLTLEDFAERQKEDIEQEEEQYNRLFGHEGAS
jgi:hypothetical protein